MPTSSTKSRDRKARRRAEADAAAQASAVKAAATAQTPAAPRDSAVSSLTERAWWIGCASVLAVATLLRVVDLELKPLHHDEGVNGFFLLGLVRQGKYQYNPSNYHGPTLYYFTLPLASFADAHHWLSTWVLRAVTVAFGLATVWLALRLRRYIGAVGALACAALLAVSPGMVFFSRYYIHEMLFVFFTLGIVVGALRFYEGERAEPAGWLKKVGGAAGLLIAVCSFALVVISYVTAKYSASLTRAWTVILLLLIVACLAALVALLRLYDGARVYYLALASVCAALMFATKETAFITAGVLLIAWGMAELWVRFVARRGWGRDAEPKGKKARGGRAAGAADGDAPAPLRLAERLGGWTHALFLLAGSVALFLFVNIIYYSSFFTNPRGVTDAREALYVWRKTGESGFHGYPFYKYFEWLVGATPLPPEGSTHGIFEYILWVYRNWHWEFGEEAPLFILATLGALLALWKTRRRFPLFAALWGFGLFAAYSIIKYKTPWLALSWLLPFAVSGGYAVDRLYRMRARGWRVVSLALLGFALAVGAWQSYRLNFVHYDDDRYAYVYAHTKRDFHELMAQVEAITARTGNKYEAGINVAVENQEYWPLPWYVRDYKHIGYTGHVGETTDAVIIVKVAQAPEVEKLFGSRYQRVGGEYTLRPGVEFALYARRDLVGR